MVMSATLPGVRAKATGRPRSSAGSIETDDQMLIARQRWLLEVKRTWRGLVSLQANDQSGHSFLATQI